MTALAMFSVGTQTSYADDAVLTPTQTTVIQADGKTAQNANTVLYNAEATSWRYSQAKINGGAFTNMLANYEGSPVVLTKFDASTTLKGKLLKKATLSFYSVCTVSKKNSNVQVASINTGWDATTATWTNTNTAEILNAVCINGDGDNVKTSKKELSYDVTSYLQASTNNTLGIALFTFTGREQEASDFKLTLEYVDAASATNYTVKYVDAAGNEIKTSSTYVAESGLVPPLTESDKDAIYNEDKTVKYVYDSDDAANLKIAADGSTVVTIKFREAAKWNYTFNAVDEEGNPLQEGIVKGTNFEGETFDVGYPYAINVDSTLYTSDKLSSDKKGYYLSYTLEADNQVKNITFKPTTTTDIVFLSEAENIEGLTKATNNNTFVRSSNGGSAYAAEADVEITKLQPGKYKLTAVICDATKNAGSEWNFLAGENNIFKFTASSVNWAQGTSEEFEVNAETPIYLVKGGNANQAVDFIYIQKTGDAEALPTFTEVNSIAELHSLKFKDENDEIPVKINLKDAKITALHKNSDYGVEMIDFAILEDATGAIDISSLMMEATAEGTLEGDFAEGSVLNGTLYATLNWPNSLWASEDTEKSQITLTTSTVVPTEATLAEVIKPENDLRLFKLQDVTIKNVGTEEAPDFDICQGEASIELRDAFAKWKSDGSDMPEKLQSVTGILYAGYESLDQETPNYFFTPLSYEAASAAPIEVNSIAELNKLGEENEGATIKLKLTDAQITVADASMSSAIIEDKTGAFNAQYFFAEAVGTEMLKDEFKQGVVLNGYLYAKYSYGSIEVCENTANSDITTTEAPVVPTEADFAEVLKSENNFRLYEFKNITVNKNESDKFQLVKGDAKAEIADGTHSLDESMMANVESVVGYFRIAGDEAEFTLLSYKTATPDGISALEVAAKNAAVYNLNGAKVRNIGESVKGLAKGIYVVGGKKIVVK